MQYAEGVTRTRFPENMADDVTPIQHQVDIDRLQDGQE